MENIPGGSSDTIVSKGKYKKADVGELVIKGCPKDVIPPVRDLWEKWFVLLFKHIQSKAGETLQACQVQFNYVELVVACYCELEALWNQDVQAAGYAGMTRVEADELDLDYNFFRGPDGMTRWRRMTRWWHFIEDEVSFSAELDLEYNRFPGPAWVYKVVDSNNVAKFIYAKDYNIDLREYRCDAKSILEDCIQRIVNFTFLPQIFKIDHDKVDELYARRTIMFENLNIDVTFPHFNCQCPVCVNK